MSHLSKSKEFNVFVEGPISGLHILIEVFHFTFTRPIKAWALESALFQRKSSHLARSGCFGYFVFCNVGSCRSITVVASRPMQKHENMSRRNSSQYRCISALQAPQFAHMIKAFVSCVAEISEASNVAFVEVEGI